MAGRDHASNHDKIKQHAPQLLREHVRQKRRWYRINPKDLSPSELHSALPNGCGEQAGPARTSARFAMPSTAGKQNLLCALSSAFSRG